MDFTKNHNLYRVDVLDISGSIKQSYIFAGDAPKSAIKSIKGGDIDDDFSFDSIPIESIDESIAKDILLEDNKSSLIEVTEKNNTTGVIIIEEFSITPNDTVMDLKQKIYAVSGIIPMKQLIYTSEKSPKHIGYELYIDDVPQDPLPPNVSSDKTIKFDDIKISIDMNMFKQSNYISIHAVDNFQLIEHFGVKRFTLYDFDSYLMNSNGFLPSSIKDRYEQDMIYYGFILKYWPACTKDIYEQILSYNGNIVDVAGSFPDIMPNAKQILHNYKTEYDMYSKITNKLLADIAKELSSSITSARLVNQSPYAKPAIRIRQLFDVLPLTPLIVYCKANLTIVNEVNNQINNISLIKQYELVTNRVGAVKYDKIPTNTIMYRIIISPKTEDSLYFILHENSNYSIRTHWNWANGYGYDDIYRIVRSVVNPVIDEINNLPVFTTTTRLEHVNKNIVFNSVSTNVLWQRKITGLDFKILQKIIEDLIQIDVLKFKSNDHAQLAVYFKRGMFEADTSRINKSMYTNNQYEYLSNNIFKLKYNSLFIDNHSMVISHTPTGIKIEIENLKEFEFKIFQQFLQMFIVNVLDQLNNKKRLKQVDDESKFEKSQKRALQSNKEIDPELYNAKKLYSTNFVYSRICQKPYQPDILTDVEYKSLDPIRKKNAVLYWNFTQKKPIWYSCDNDKYPHLKFIVGKHPKNYCVPCCKKTGINDNSNTSKQLIHNTCLTEHVWTQNKRTITESSRYIMSFGKTIEQNRLSRLPERSLELIFYDVFIQNSNGIDQECMQQNTKGYYLYGVQQNTQSINEIGILYSLANIFDYSVNEFIKEIIERLDKANFHLLMNGKIINYFPNVDNLKYFFELFLDNMNIDGIIPYEISTIIGDKLDKILISILYHYFKTVIMLFEINPNSDTNNLIINNNSSNIDDIFPSTHKVGIILKKLDNIMNEYYPIYNVDINVFFKTRVVDEKIYNADSVIVDTIKDLIATDIQRVNTDVKITNKITIDIITKFIDSSRITKYHINNRNMVYAVIIDNDIYLPVEPFKYIKSKTPIDYKPFKRTPKFTYKKLAMFVDKYNKWVISKSQSIKLPIYPYIHIQKWIYLLPKKQVIGFVSKTGHVYYFYETKPAFAKSKVNVKFVPYLYDPQTYMDLLQRNVGPKPDIFTKTIDRELYKYYMYDILLLNISNYYRKSKNKAVRKQIKGIFIKAKLINDRSSIVEKLRELITDYSDYEDISMLISKYIKTGDKSVFESFDNKKYYFDYTEVMKLANLSKPDLHKKIKQIISSFTTIGEYNKKFPNYLPISNKLPITREELDKYIPILASDLTNELKRKWILSGTLITRLIDKYRFYTRPFEKISLSMN